jgi:beta-glucosidase
MSLPTGHTHRLSSVKKGREPDVSSDTATASLPGPFRPDETFFWGVATSGYQAEGGYNGPGEPLNNWAWAESNGDVVPSGRTSDFWTLAHEDFGRCRDMGLNAFRMSIEWARVQPGTVLGPTEGLAAGAEPPPFDERALYSYAQRIADCRAHGLEPIITLHHFVHPAWLGIDAWLKPETIDRFLVFVERTISYLLRTLPEDFNCDPPRWFITINEPNLLALNHYSVRIFPGKAPVGMKPTVLCLAHLLEAHVRAYRKIHELYARSAIKPMVSFNNYASDLYWNDTAMLDLLFAPSRKVPRQLLREDLSERAHAFDARFNAARLFPPGAVSSPCFTNAPRSRSITSPSITTTPLLPMRSAGRLGMTSIPGNVPSVIGCSKASPANGGTGGCCRKASPFSSSTWDVTASR